MQKFKGKLYKFGTAKNRLKDYYNLASDLQKSGGLNWYNEANQFCKDIAKESGLELFQVVGIVAALSPQKSWDANKDIAYKFIIKKQDTGLHNGVQMNKAYDCLHAENFNEVYNLLSKDQVKTSQFFFNILFPSVDNNATIDRHALGSIIYNQNNIKSISDNMSKMTKKQYFFFSDCYKLAAKELGILTHELQAVVWVVYRELKGLPEQYEIKTEFPF